MESLGSANSGAFSLEFARLKFYWRFFGNMPKEKLAGGVTIYNNGFISLVNLKTNRLDVYDTTGKLVYEGISGFYVFDNGYKLVVYPDKTGEVFGPVKRKVLKTVKNVCFIAKHNSFLCKNKDCYELYQVNRGISAPFILKKAVQICGLTDNKDGFTALRYTDFSELLDKKGQVIGFDRAFEVFCFEKDGSISALDKRYQRFKVDVEQKKLVALPDEATPQKSENDASKTETTCFSCHRCYTKNGQIFVEWPTGAFVSIMAEHYLTIDFDGKFLVFDVNMATGEIFGALSSLVYEFGCVEEDISRQMFEYLVLLTKCLSGIEFSLKEAYKQYLLGCC
ncbi:MAG: hypothetical protein J6C85_05590 [Alphaproteobacteria bacterium]|nr:hypothetical protein [Alphaproteobacteria bacterium]